MCPTGVQFDVQSKLIITHYLCVFLSFLGYHGYTVAVLYVFPMLMDRQICLLVLCGVPASGKSTLAGRLSSQINCVAADCSEYKDSNVNFVVISYDELIPEEEEKRLVLASTVQVHV